MKVIRFKRGIGKSARWNWVRDCHQRIRRFCDERVARRWMRKHQYEFDPTDRIEISDRTE